MTPATISTPHATNITAEDLRKGPQTPLLDTSTVDSMFLPLPRDRRGLCPCCNAPAVSTLYYVGGAGYLTVTKCWLAMGGYSDCDYRRVL